MRVSEVDGNGYQIISGYLEKPRLDEYGIDATTSFILANHHDKNRWELGVVKHHGIPSHHYAKIASGKGETLVHSEVPALLKKYGLAEYEEVKGAKA